MNTHLLSLTALLAVSVSRGTVAQTVVVPAVIHAAVSSVAASAVGHWLYGPQGNIIGSVRSLAADGQTVVIMVGSYFQTGGHQARIPTTALSMVNGKVTLRTETAEALSIASR